MTLLQKRDAQRLADRLAAFDTVRAQLREALHELIPGERIIVFGSLTRRGIFNAASDIDIALEREPRALTAGQLMVELGERLNRRVDVVELASSRLREKIQREGELWTT